MGEVEASVPKYQKKIDGKRTELSNFEQGMIIAFVAIYGGTSTVSVLAGRPLVECEELPRLVL